MTRRPPPAGRRPPPNRARRRPGSTALPRIILGFFGVAAIALFFGMMSVYASYTSDLPTLEGIEDFDLAEGSTVYSADGVELATFAIEDRRAIDFDEIPQVMVDAQVAAEDQTFWTNPCVDLRSIVRAFLQNFQAGETVSGASTVCQQLVRMRLFDAEYMADPERQVERKIKEALLALRLDRRFPGDEGKEQILAMYMNQSYYGNNAYGIWAAANAYFGKDITSDAPEDQLSVSEAALLAGLVRAPSRLDPTNEAVQVETGGRDDLRRARDRAVDLRAQPRAAPDARFRVHHPGRARRGRRRGDRARAAAQPRLSRSPLRLRRPPRGIGAARRRAGARHRRAADLHHPRVQRLPGRGREVGEARVRPGSADRGGACRGLR